ncbi:MAG: radical SAM protein [Bacteroidetes bacterium]|nr:radical SAM protein [Bacteroidota bacterium]
MKNTLIISFDLIRTGEVEKPLAIASILTYLKSDKRLQEAAAFHHISINILNYGGRATSLDFDNRLAIFDLEKFDFIAISAYVWNEYLINPFIQHLRNLGYRNKIVLGGYQISYSDTRKLPAKYPDCQVFITGYAEQSFKQLYSLNSTEFPVFLNAPVDFTELPSSYLNNEIEVAYDSQMVRLETKRGCPYRCSFCAHRDLTKNKMHKHPLEKVFQEISFLTERRVKRINILDPIFNTGKEHIEVMREINRVNATSKFTLQTRFELIKGETGKQFLELCSNGNYHLEFGLQTSNISEATNINRQNKNQIIDEVFEEIKDRNISYEVSLIYGLPGQTLDSFQRSIEYVQKKGCTSVKAYPLMLLRGTELFHQKGNWNLKEEEIGDFNIPVVTSSSTFSKNDWWQMHGIAEQLMETGRI